MSIPTKAPGPPTVVHQVTPTAVRPRRNALKVFFATVVVLVLIG